MSFENWFGKTEDLKLCVVTDTKQMEVAEYLKGLKYQSYELINIDETPFDIENIQADMIIVSLSFDSFIYKKYNGIFSPFKKPKGYNGKYVFIRLDIELKSLKESLMTDKEVLIETVDQYLAYEKKCFVKVSGKSGTEMTFKINEFSTCSHFIDDTSDMAFLPPSEVCAGIEVGSANGVIVVDVTIGQINQYGKWLGMFGLVDKNVQLMIENSRVVDVIGNDGLKEVLFSLDEADRTVVELGIGLSSMTPTGVISIDESIYGTCHFGIGDGDCVKIDHSASIHLDVVIDAPVIGVSYEDD